MAWLRRLVTGTDPGNVSEKAAEIQIRKKKYFCQRIITDLLFQK